MDLEKTVTELQAQNSQFQEALLALANGAARYDGFTGS